VLFALDSFEFSGKIVRFEFLCFFNFEDEEGQDAFCLLFSKVCTFGLVFELRRQTRKKSLGSFLKKANPKKLFGDVNRTKC